MKKFTYTILPLLAAVISLVACKSEVEDVFDTSSAERLQQTKTATLNVLTAAPNGWRAEYYGDTSYGGYNVFFKFTNDSVTVASEQVGDSQTAGVDANGNAVTCTTHYTLDQSMGLLLSFDEYNSIFHYFSDPNITDKGALVSDGLGGDFEFRVISASADSVILKGKKHGASIKMYPMDANTTWGQYIQQVKETEEYMSSRSYTLEADNLESSVSVTTRYRDLYFTYLNDEGTAEQSTAPYIVTPEGFKFYKPVTVKGVEMTGFDKGTTDEYFAASNNANTRIYTYTKTLAESLESGMWFIKYDDLGEYAQKQWDVLFEGLGQASADKTRNRLYWALIGTYSKTTGFSMQAGSDNVVESFTFKAANEEGDEVTIKFDSKSSNKKNPSKTYYNNYGVKEAIEPFTNGTKGRTFKLTADSRRHPSYIILTDKDEPTNVIKLWYEQVTYPFGDRDKTEK